MWAGPVDHQICTVLACKMVGRIPDSVLRGNNRKGPLYNPHARRKKAAWSRRSVLLPREMRIAGLYPLAAGEPLPDVLWLAQQRGWREEGSCQRPAQCDGRDEQQVRSVLPNRKSYPESR